MLADTLKAMRLRSGMTLEQLAKASGVPLSTISRISSGETKEPSFATVSALVLAMGGSMDELSGNAPQSVQNARTGASECKGDNCPQIKLYERQRLADEQWRNGMVEQSEKRIDGIKAIYEKRIDSIERKYLSQLAVKDKWIRSLMLMTTVALVIIAVIVVADLLLSDIGFIRR